MNGASAMQAVFTRDVRVYFRNRSAWLNPLLFVLLAITLFALGIGPDPAKLGASAPGIMWVVALLGIMLSMDLLFRADFDDGSLEQLLLSPASLYFNVIAKVAAHWLVTGLPLILATPLFVIMLGLSSAILPTLALGILLGSGILSFLGAIGAALTVSLRSGGLLIALLILPLYTPVIIFGARMIQDAIDGWTVMPAMAMLSGMLVAAIVLAPLAIAAALRFSIDAQ